MYLDVYKVKYDSAVVNVAVRSVRVDTQIPGVI